MRKKKSKEHKASLIVNWLNIFGILVGVLTIFGTVFEEGFIIPMLGVSLLWILLGLSRIIYLLEERNEK